MPGFRLLQGYVLTAAITCLSVAIVGCNPQCEPPVSDHPVPMAQASLSTFWSDPAHHSVTIVITDSPYRLSASALDVLVDVLTDQIGLDVTVVEGGDTGLPATGVLSANQVIATGRSLAPETDQPVLVIIVVSDTDQPDATFGFLSYQNSPRPVAVMCIQRDSALAYAIGPITPDAIEALPALHELGHWFEIPARDHHISAVDNQHCTNAQCVMFKGGRITPCVVFANLATGLPLHFGPACAEELAEMRTRRSVSNDAQ